VQISQMTIRYQSAVRGIFFHTSAQILPAASMSGLVLTLIAVLAGALGAWRLGVDPGWTSPFFVSRGLFSRYQWWFAGGPRCANVRIHPQSLGGESANRCAGYRRGVGDVPS
jgi:hypothetical protein